MQASRSRWGVPMFAVALGVVMLIAQTVGHHVGEGIVSLAIMCVMAAVFAFGGRSETIRGLRGDGRDERFAHIDLRASWFAGMAVLISVIVAFVVEAARGRDGAPFTWLGAIGGLAYVAAVLVQRLRS